mmetsp:Transcript_783/g.2412  ORF Transcript_783/g.2412 Transcript_783/m.2412 type:complete len:231 (+) Transcript_783:277-969(+)
MRQVLDDAMVFAELKSQGRIAQSGDGPDKTKEGYTIERVDLSAEDGGFKEWQEKHWWARVYSGKSYGEYVRLAGDKRGQTTPGPSKQETPAAAWGELEKERRANNATERLDPSSLSLQTDSQALLKPSFAVTVPGERPPAQLSYRSFPQRRPADDCLWIVIVLVLIFYAWRLFKDQLEAQLAPDDGDGERVRRHLATAATVASALANAKAGDTLTAEMMAELVQLLARGQ